MLPVKLGVGNYRMVTDVWYAKAQPPQTVRTVWADFIISETNVSLTLDNVRAIQIDAADLERIWDNSDGNGIDIRYNDVDEFVKSHPSSEATVSSASEKVALSNTPISEKVNIVITPTDHDPRYSYYYLPEDQLKFSGMMDAIQRTPLNKFPADAYHLNICVAKDWVSWEMLSNGAFYYRDDELPL